MKHEIKTLIYTRFKFALLLCLVAVCSLVNLQSQESYKGHYKVVNPEHKVSLENLKNQANNNQNNVISLKQLKEQEEKEKLLKQQELENKKLKQELAKQQANQNKLKQEQQEFKKLQLLQAKQIKNKKAKEQELKAKLINQRRANIIYGLYNNQLKTKVQKDEYSDEYAKDVSSLPTIRKRIITNDMYIIGLLENSINTQINSGRAVIVVEEPVYSAEGRSLVFPKGSRIVCTYSSLEQGGDTRVPMECLRVLRPDGVSVLLNNIILADQMGKTGAVGQVDNRVFEKYGHALTMASVSGLSSYGSFALATSNNANLVALSPTLNETNEALSDVTAQILNKTLDLSPIITVAKGTRIVLMPLNDIYIAKQEYEEIEQ